MTTDNNIIEENKIFDIIVYSKCIKCSNAGTAEHNCPFSEEIYNDHETLCNCCESCAGNCAMDI